MFPHLFFRKLGKSDSSKTCIPGSFPEGKPGGTGRQTGRRFPSSMSSGPELERETRGLQPASPRKISRLPGRETEGDPEGKVSKVTCSKELPRDLDFPLFACLSFPGKEECRKQIKYFKTPSPGSFPEGKRVFHGRQTGRVIFEDSVR